MSLYASHELAGLFLFLLVEEAGVPLLFPGDLLIVAAGARAAPDAASWLAVIGVSAAASTLGSSLLYIVARRGGRPLLARASRILHVGEPAIATAEVWMRRGALAIIVGRLVPGLRTPTSIASGLFDVPYRVFAPATACAALVWASAYFLVGALARSQSGEVANALAGDVDVAAIGILILAVAAAVTALVLARRRHWRL